MTGCTVFFLFFQRLGMVVVEKFNTWPLQLSKSLQRIYHNYIRMFLIPFLRLPLNAISTDSPDGHNNNYSRYNGLNQ